MSDIEPLKDLGVGERKRPYLACLPLCYQFSDFISEDVECGASRNNVELTCVHADGGKAPLRPAHPAPADPTLCSGL